MIVYETLKRPLYAFCLRLAGNADDAADAVQEAFIRLLDRSADIAAAGAVKSWLYTTARNHLYNGFRRAGHLTAIDEEKLEAEGSPYVDAERVDETEYFTRILARLSVDHREVLVLREYEGYTYEEMAAMLGVPATTIKMRLFKARKTLARCYTAMNRTR
jgi:RNA polymerase sigma-70 factor, ECF subfamily